MKALSFELEYAKEDNGDLLDSNAWNALVAWQFETAWKPKISYRYAVFEGDDPNTAENEAFDGLWTGFYDWGAWWQGEIAGEYFASNSNLVSSQLRVHAKPNDAIGTGLILYDFTLDNTESAGITSDNLAHGARLVHGLVVERQLHREPGGGLRASRPRPWKRDSIATRTSTTE